MVGTIVYRLALPPSLSRVHVVFHVSILRKYTPYLTHIVDWGELVVDAGDVTPPPLLVAGVLATPSRFFQRLENPVKRSRVAC